MINWVTGPSLQLNERLKQEHPNGVTKLVQLEAVDECEYVPFIYDILWPCEPIIGDVFTGNVRKADEECKEKYYGTWKVVRRHLFTSGWQAVTMNGMNGILLLKLELIEVHKQ